MPDAGENVGCSVTILDIGSVNDGSDEETLLVRSGVCASVIVKSAASSLA